MFLADLEEPDLLRIAQNACGSYASVSTAAFTEIYQRYSAALFRTTSLHLRRGGVPSEEAHALAVQVTSDVFLETGFSGPPMRYFLRFGGYHVGPNSFRNFLGSYRCRLTANALKRYWLQHRSIRLGGVPVELAQEEGISLLERLDLLQQLDQLSEDDQLLLTMRAAGYPHQEIAGMLNTTSAACRQRLRRIRQLFSTEPLHISRQP